MLFSVFSTAIFLFFFAGNLLMHVLRYCGLASLSYWKHVLRYSFTAGKFNYLQLSFNIPKFQHKQSKIHMSTITCIKTPVIRADIGKIHYYLRNTNHTINKLLFYYISMTSAGFFYLLLRETVFQLNSESCIFKVQDWAVEIHLHTTQQKTTV